MRKFIFDRNEIKLRTEVSGTYTNREKNTVCVTVRWKLLVPSFLKDWTFFMEHSKEENNPFYGETKGVAYCLDEDKFNPVLGEKIARAKAEAKAYEAASKNITSIIMAIGNAVDRLVDLTGDFNLKSVKVQKHNVEYIKRIA